MSRIFKPRRANKSSAKTPSGRLKNLILEEGEFMILKDDIDPNANNAYDFFIGDGVTPLSDLPSSIAGGGSSERVTIIPDSSSTSTQAINNIVSNSLLGALIGSIKQALIKINSEKANVSHTHSQYAAISHNHDDRYTKLNNNATFTNEVKINAGVGASDYPRVNFARDNSTRPVKIDSPANNEIVIGASVITVEDNLNGSYNKNSTYFTNSNVYITNKDSGDVGTTKLNSKTDGLVATSLDNNSANQNTNLYLFKKKTGEAGANSKVLTKANFTLVGDVLYIDTESV